MGLFSGISNVIGKVVQAKKDKKAGRQGARKAKRDERRQFKLDKIKTRQGAKTERTTIRNEAKVAKASIDAETDQAAYAAGFEPEEHNPGLKALGIVGGAVSSIFGGGDDGEGQYSEDVNYGGELDGVTVSASRIGKPNFLLYGAIAVGAYLLLNNKSRRRG